MLTAEQIDALSRKTLVEPIQIGQSVLIEINGKNGIIGQIKNFDQDNVTVELNDEGYYAILPIEIISPVDSKAVNDIIGFLPSYDENGPEIKSIKDAGYETGNELDESANDNLEFKKGDIVITPDGKGKILKFRRNIEHWIVQMDDGAENGYPAKDLKLENKKANESKGYDLIDNQIFDMFITCDSPEEFLDGMVLIFESDADAAFEDLTEMAISVDMDENSIIGIPNYPKNNKSFFDEEQAIELYHKLKESIDGYYYGTENDKLFDIAINQNHDNDLKNLVDILGINGYSLDSDDTDGNCPIMTINLVNKTYSYSTHRENPYLYLTDIEQIISILNTGSVNMIKFNESISNETSSTKKFDKGFVKGDTIVDETDRYIKVSNNGKIFVVGDNGERREFITKNGNVIFNPPLNRSALKGDLSILDIKFNESPFNEAGGSDNSVALPNCNLWLNGGGTDMNGNNLVKLSFPNSRAFSLQTNGGLKETDYLIRKNTKVNKLSDGDLAKIEKEVVNYIQKFGSRVQKATLKTYGGFNEATISTASVDEIDTPQKLGFALKKFFKAKYDVDLSRTNYIKTVKGLDGSYYEISTFRNGQVIPNEFRQKAVLAAYNKTEADKESMNVRGWDTDISYGNINKHVIAMSGRQWKKLLKEMDAVTEAVDSKQMKSFLDDFKDNDVVDTNLPSCSEKDLVSLTDNDAPKSYLPEGYFKVEEFIKISPGGGWSISFQPGTIVYSDGNGVVDSTSPKLILKGLEEFNPFIFKSTRPPIQGVDKLVISRYGRYPEQRQMYNAFVENVQPLSGQQAYDAIVKILSDYSPEKVGEATISIPHAENLKSIALYIPLKQSKDFADFEKKIFDGAIIQEDIQELCAILNVPDATNGGSLDIDYDPAKLEVAYNKAKKSLPTTAGSQIPQGGLSRTVWTNPVITSYKGQNGYLGSNQSQFRTDQLDMEIESYFHSLGMDDDMIACFLVGKEGRWLSTALKNGADWKSFIRNTAFGFIADFDPSNKIVYQESLIKENDCLILEKSSNPLKLKKSDFSAYRKLDFNQFIPYTSWSKFMDNIGFGIDDMDRICKYIGFDTFEKLVDSGITPLNIKSDSIKYQGLLDGIKVISSAARNMTAKGLDMLIESFINEEIEDTGSAKYTNRVNQKYEILVKQYNENPNDKKILAQLNDCERYLNLKLTESKIHEARKYIDAFSIHTKVGGEMLNVQFNCGIEMPNKLIGSITVTGALLNFIYHTTDFPDNARKITLEKFETILEPDEEDVLYYKKNYDYIFGRLMDDVNNAAKYKKARTEGLSLDEILKLTNNKTNESSDYIIKPKNKVKLEKVIRKTIDESKSIDHIKQIANALKNVKESELENLKADIERWEITDFDDDNGKQKELDTIINHYK